MDGGGNPAAGIGDGNRVVDETRDVLSGGNARDRPGQDVIEHQRGNAELGERASERFFDDAVDAAAHEHGAAFDVDGAHGEGEQHHPQDEPGRALSNGLFGNASGVEGGRAQIVENDGGGSPIRDKGEHHRGRNYNANPVIAWRCVGGSGHAAGAYWAFSSSLSSMVPTSSMPVRISTTTDPAHPATNINSTILMRKTVKPMIPICYLIGADFGAGIVAESCELRATSCELRAGRLPVARGPKRAASLLS